VNRVLVVIALVVAAVGAVVVLRNTTMTVHTRMPADSSLVVEATARSRDAGASAPALTRALVTSCVAETSHRRAVQDYRWRPPRSVTFTVAPALDEPDRRQLHGCLSDLRVPRLLVSVDRMRSVGVEDEDG
jgi:hypothetical protein